jgi:hypothetical protein
MVFEAIWLMVEGNTAQAGNLKDIPHRIIDINKPYPIRGVVFPAFSRQLALERLGMVDLYVDVLETDVMGVGLLSKDTVKRVAAGPPKKVTITGYNRVPNQIHIVRVLEEFSRKLDVEINVSYPKGKPSITKNTPGTLFVRLYSAPSLRSRLYLNEVFKVRLSGDSRYSFRPTNNGTPIRDQKGNMVAQLYGTTLFILFNLPRSQQAGNILKSIMEEVAKLYELHGDPSTQIPQKPLDKALKGFLGFCRQRNTEHRQVRTKVQDLARQIAHVEATLTRLRDEEQRYRTRLEILEQDSEPEDQYKRDFTRIVEHPDIRSIEVTASKISVLTSPIDIEYQGDTYQIGQFRIEIYPKASKRFVKCFNTWGAKKVGGYYKESYHHPHVKTDGICTSRELRGEVARLISDSKYYELVEKVLDYLKTVNPQSWSLPITKWPKKS